MELFGVTACHKKILARVPGSRWASGAHYMDTRRSRVSLLVYPGRSFSKLFGSSSGPLTTPLNQKDTEARSRRASLKQGSY